MINERAGLLCNNLDIATTISQDLENEGVELSNEKITKILAALKSIANAFYKDFLKQA